MNLKKNILRIFSANLLNMVSGLVISFIVPAILSIDSYSFLKTYLFYISYIGLFHFGFIDGMYIKYGGKDVEDIELSILKTEHSMFIKLEICVTIIFLLVAIIDRNLILFFMALSIIPINTLSFHQLFYQATGQFKIYARISYIYTMIYLILNISLVFIFRNKNYIYYCLANLISNIIIFLLLELKFYKNTQGIKCLYNKELWKNIKVGFFILLGNMSIILFYGIDRWFIKLFYSISDFAYYSFAVSMLNLINLLVTSISIALYNYLAKNEKKDEIIRIKNILIILGTCASFTYFIFAFIVTIFLKKYIPSLGVISISFAAYPYMIVISSLFVNLYKAKKLEKRYFKTVIVILIVVCIYNVIATIISKDIRGIALATTLAFITWYIYSIKDFSYLKPNIKEFMFLVINTIGFLIASNYLNLEVGAIVYLIILIGSILIFFKDTVKNEITNVLKIKYKN
ncbi:capsular biosynthesis protein [Clostridium thermobutyricum]|uniref:capsular biosynthesis protein n=1 Tax=Clostridium thermobutyricum TaxID=29372 RepID=UPI0029426F27|nr:capsular biosynthesis protein [Clostridium thermobutyricum]